ncbi:hypothetical protein QCA50_000562 [Cerrena zonata]|uniref:PIN domain-containing protein n=1 Tax=Cerrena zonata TaxID=2478898 RepID=A0AAW0GQM5_9APHY
MYGGNSGVSASMWAPQATTSYPSTRSYGSSGSITSNTSTQPDDNHSVPVNLSNNQIRKDNTLDRILNVANEDVEMVDVGVPTVMYLVVDTNFLIDQLDVLKRFTNDLEELSNDPRFPPEALGLKVIIPTVVLSELDGLKKGHQNKKDGKDGNLAWFAHTAATWLLEKSKERKFVKVQARKETVYDPTVTVGHAPTLGNDLAIFDCLQYFKTQGNVALVTYDTLLCTYVDANDILHIKPPTGKDKTDKKNKGTPRWSSRCLAYEIYKNHDLANFFHSADSGPGYRRGNSSGQVGISQAPAADDDEAMDIDDDASKTQRLEDFEPSHALDALHLQIIEHFTAVLKEVTERVRLAAKDDLTPTTSMHAPSYRRKLFYLWDVGDCLDYLDSKKRLRKKNPPLQVFLLRRNQNRGWRRGQDWSRQDWRIALQALEEIGQLFDEGVVLESLESLNPHVEFIFAQPMRPTG